MKKIVFFLVLLFSIGAFAQQQTISTSGQVTIGPEFVKINANFSELYTAKTTLQAQINTNINDINSNDYAISNNTTNIGLNTAELNAQKALDETATTALNIGSFRTFSKAIGTNQQFTIINEVQGAVFDIYSPTGTGTLNAALFTHASKTITVQVFYAAYDPAKKCTISVKLLKVTTDEIILNYFVLQS
jgi:hypothetical protein